GKEEGREEGREEGIEKVAKNMLAQGIDVEIIASVTGFSKEEIKRLQNL
ncbi:MAG: hypothetical protein ACD_16C00039G0001, partial [uncultured bacterium]